MTVNEEVAYIEEENIGLDLRPVTFDSQNKKFYAISGKDVISYDVESGKRLKFFRHSEPVIGLHFINRKFFTITQSGTIVEWNVEEGIQLSKAAISSERFNLLWSYEVESVDEVEQSPQIWLYAQKLAGLSGGDECDSMEVDESSSDNSMCHSLSTSLFRLDFEDQVEAEDIASKPKLHLVLEIPDRIASKRQMAVGPDFVLIAKGRELKLIPLSHFKGKINGPLCFTHTTKFDIVGGENVAFDEVLIVDDTVLAGLNFGRLYFWNKVRECGLGPANKSYQAVSTGSFTSAVSCSRTIFTGDGTGAIHKWNLSTSGLGRWQKLEFLFMSAPVERILLSADGTLLLAILEDNSVYVLRTSTLTIQQRCKVLEWNSAVSPLDWAQLNADPAQPDFVVSNARLGHIQWIDPAKWRTIVKYDISEENTPPRDSFHIANYLWLNVYLVHLTASRMITCECRRNDFDKTYLKIYRRIKAGSMSDFRLEECLIYPRRVAFIRSNSDENNPNAAEAPADGDEVLRIDADGLLDVFVTDSLRVGRWRLDANRRAVSWRKSRVQSCSHVRFDAFATVNTMAKNSTAVGGENPQQEDRKRSPKKRKSNRRTSRRSNEIVGDETADRGGLHSETDDDDDDNGNETAIAEGSQSFVLLWQLPFSLRIFQVVECVPDAKQVEWAPPNPEGKSILLICGASGICGYNPQDASVMWKVEQTGFSLFSSRLTCFVHDSNTVVFFDAICGDLKKVLRFKSSQTQIIASGSNAKNIRLSGLSKRGISVLKADTPENTTLCGTSFVARKTPFSELLAKSGATASEKPSEKEAPPSFVELQAKIPLASKIFDGPAYTLAPLVQIAPLYIRSCMIPKRKPD